MKERVYVPAARPAIQLTAFWLPLLALLGLYLAVALMAPAPYPSAGLDPSWRAGLSLAFVRGLTFGRDIVFTYGPLGFLLNGTLLPQTWLPIVAFRIFVAAALIGLAFYRARELATMPRRTLFVAGVALAVPALECEYQILFALMLFATAPLVRERLNLRAGALLGVLTGLCFLGKFSLAVDAAGATTILFGFQLIERPAERRAVLRMLGVVISTFGWSLIFGFAASSHDWLLIGLGLLALAPGIWAYIAKARLVTTFSCAMVCYALVAVALSLPLRAYVAAGLSIVDGYSSAMTIVDSAELVVIAGLVAAAFAIAVFATERLPLSLILSLAFLGFTSFKYSFVRQDAGHVIVFFAVATFLATLVFAAAAAARDGFRWGMVVIVLLATTVIVEHRELGYWSLLEFAPSAVGDKVRSLAAGPPVAAPIEADVLPGAVRSAIGSSSVDIEPWEVSAMVGTSLSWSPLPIFQGYAAYEPMLDRLNATRLASDAGPAFIIFSVLDIDGRVQAFDEPSTFLGIVCGFRVVPQMPAFMLDGYPAMLLRRAPNACATPVDGETWHGVLSAPIPVPRPPHGSLVLAALHTEPSLFGRLRRIFYRAEPMNLRLTDIAGHSVDIRVLADQIRQPFVLDPPVTSFADGSALLAMQPNVRLRSIQLLVADPTEYESSMSVSFSFVALHR